MLFQLQQVRNLIVWPRIDIAFKVRAKLSFVTVHIDSKSIRKNGLQRFILISKTAIWFKKLKYKKIINA